MMLGSRFLVSIFALWAMPLKPLPVLAQGASPKGEAGTKIVTQMPWEKDGFVASGHVQAALQALLINAAKDGRGVHVETVMTMAGALAGFAAQHAVWETVVKLGKLPESGGANLKAGAFVVVKVKSGETFYFGDHINAYLVPQASPFGPGDYTLWGFLEASMRENRAKSLAQPEIAEIFKNTASTIGSGQFGVPRLPEAHKPRVSPREALNKLWPEARKILDKNDWPGAKGKTISPAHWTSMIALTTKTLIAQSKGSLDPAISMKIVFEAAIPMSKVDPKTVP